MDKCSESNKYLHKKFKKQTSIEPSIVVASHVPTQRVPEQHQQPFWHHPNHHNSTNSDESTLKSSISVRPAGGNGGGTRPVVADSGYTLIKFCELYDRQEPPVATALVVRQIDSSEQSDEDISNTSRLKRSGAKEPSATEEHFIRSSSIASESGRVVTSSSSSGSSNHRVTLLDDAREEVGAPNANASTSTSNGAVSTGGGGGGGKYVCPYCNLACSKPSVLQKHIRAHTNERPYPCQSCNFSFKTRSNLYKHCRSRTHVNRVMGNKSQDGDPMHPMATSSPPPPSASSLSAQLDRPSVIADAPMGYLNNNRDELPMKNKPYKPRFHTKSYYDNENEENSLAFSNEKNSLLDAAEHISGDMNVNSSTRHMIIAGGIDACEHRLPPVENHNYIAQSHIGNHSIDITRNNNNNNDEPLNLTNKNRKRCMSEVFSEPTKKSLIKELLLKNLCADSNMQCPHCKMIFRTFTELELHKMKMCKGRGASRYNRSSSVNVASILTQNKNAFDSMPQIASMFHMKSPGPFLGKTRLVDSDKSKSFSCDDSIQGGGIRELGKESPYYQSSFDFFCDKTRKPTVKLFGGEVKVMQASGLHENGDVHHTHAGGERVDYKSTGKLSENRVIRNTLQSGGIVVHAAEKQPPQNASVIKTNEKIENRSAESRDDYANIMDFSQNAAKLLAPNLKQLNLTIPGIPALNKFIETSQPSLLTISSQPPKPQPPTIADGDLKNPLSLLVNGKVVRHVPGMPGPVVAAETIKPKIQITPVNDDLVKPLATETMTTTSIVSSPAAVKVEVQSPPSTVINASCTTGSSVKLEGPDPRPEVPPRKFARPNSLALKPSSASLKHHHGLTPTMFNQILISPDTPRGDKKYNEQFLHGNYFSYLGLKSSTRPVYCTLNKTQPFYVPHFKKLSMYSEWRQQDNKSDKLYVSNYDSRQRNSRYFIAGKYRADNLVHSSYKYVAGDVTRKTQDVPINANGNPTILGGYESHDDYTYVRGRGRGRFVCEQCGIRCKKPSMLKKHIRTHSNERPYTCRECKFSFKTKGNLTKHLKSRSHTLNNSTSASTSASETDSVKSARISGGSPTSGSEIDVDDSGMDTDDDTSTRNQEQEAAYGLLSLSQKINPPMKELQSPSTIEAKCSFINAEQLAQVSKTNYAKNKILDHNVSLNTIKLSGASSDTTASENIEMLSSYQGISRPLTYPYTTQNTANEESLQSSSSTSISSEASRDQSPEHNIIHFNVIKRYNSHAKPTPSADRLITSTREFYRQQLSPTTPTNDQPQQLRPVVAAVEDRKRKLSVSSDSCNYSKVVLNESEAMDLSVNEKVNNNTATEYRKEQVVFKNTTKNNRLSATEENYLVDHYPIQTQNNKAPNGLMKMRDYDNSAMETLADIATKQEKLEKNSVAKNVATEFLKLATQNENLKTEEKSFAVSISVVPNNDLIVKSEENKNCTICNKTFNKPSQLRLHMNIHYLERPYRCDSCSVSFRTKGHLQKHERSASHHNKLSTSPALSSMEPRPFKCTDCSIAFRIHGHLAKHLRSKLHILKLECLSKIPYGLYAELERSNSLLTEINTADGVQCLDSLKALAKRIFNNDPSKLNQQRDKTIQFADASSS